MPKGFTLLELLVVVALMAAITLMVMPNFRNYNDAQKLKDAAYQVQTDLRTAQGDASTGSLCGNSTAQTWSVVFQANNTNGLNPNYQIQCQNSSGTTTTKQTTLNNGIKISKISNQGTGSCDVTTLSSNGPQISYPNLKTTPTYYFSPTCNPSADSKFVVVIQSTATNNTVSVVAEQGGSIYVQTP